MTLRTLHPKAKSEDDQVSRLRRRITSLEDEVDRLRIALMEAKRSHAAEQQRRAQRGV